MTIHKLCCHHRRGDRMCARCAKKLGHL